MCDKGSEFENLEGEEGHAHDGCGRQPHAERLDVAFSQRSVGQNHAHAAHKQNEGADRRNRNIENVDWQRPIQAAILVDEVCSDKRAEEHAV